MLELEFTPSDLANTRFAISPLWEVIAAVRVLKMTAEHPIHQPWVTQVRPRLAASNVDWRLLYDLVPAHHIPAFVAPPPSITVPDLSLELANLRTLPAERVRASLDDLDQSLSPIVDELYADPVTGLVTLAELIEAFWELALAPYWPRIRAVLDGDVLYRARQLTDGGANKLLNALYPDVSWDNDRLFVPRRHTPHKFALNGRGLLLVPSVFIWPSVFSITTPPWQPTIRYPPRGAATLWEVDDAGAPQALTAVLGKSRAQLLAALSTPASTTQLAGVAGLSTSGVSQHLTALRAAGLVSAHRTGRFVLYARTEIAESLVDRSKPK
jgi:DNA-binding transcriptional ArsR family regulator